MLNQKQVLMKITAKKSTGLLQAGFHNVEIKDVVETTSKTSSEYDDVTPQLAITFANKDGIILGWYNLKGYRLYDELTEKDQASGNYEASSTGYAIKLVKNKAGKIVKRIRVEDPERTQKSLEILGRLAANAGFEDGQEIEIEDLVEKKVGIKVGTNSQNQLRVEYSFEHGRAEELAQKEAEKAAELEEENF